MIEYRDINKPFWIAHSDDLKVVHYGTLEEGTEVVTAQPKLLSYAKKSEWSNKLNELGIEDTTS